VGVNELLLLAAGAAVVALARSASGGALHVAVGLPIGAGATAAIATGDLVVLAGVFLKAGALLFGSGYVLLAYLRGDLVDRLGWLTDGQLLDAIAIGQVTPGPLFTTATFVGYLVGGLPGALVATVAIFLPAFAFAALIGLVAARLRAWPTTAALLDGLNAGAIGLMAAVTVRLGSDGLVDGATIAIWVATAIGLLVLRLPSVVLIAGGGAAGLALGALGLIG
jgi:chromate transporter